MKSFLPFPPLYQIAHTFFLYIPLVPFLNPKFDTPGVVKAVKDGWAKFSNSEISYEEVTSDFVNNRRRSDLTDEASMKLYCSFYDESCALTDLDVNYMSGGKQPLPKSKRKETLVDESCTNSSIFMKKAHALGISIQRKTNKSLNSPALFVQEEDPSFVHGFEQINENLYARKDNRFMVFNYESISTPTSHSWPPKPVTKESGLEEDMDLLQPLKLNQYS